MKTKTQTLASIGVTTVLAATYATTSLTSASAHSDSRANKQVKVEVLALASGDNAGISGAGWFVDLDIDFDGSTLGQTIKCPAWSC